MKIKDLRYTQATCRDLGWYETIEVVVLNYFKKSYYKAFSGIVSWMKMLSENWRVEHVNIYVYLFVYVYICIYIIVFIYRRANGIYTQKSCSVWTVCPCFILTSERRKRQGESTSMDEIYQSHRDNNKILSSALMLNTICLRISYPFYLVSYCRKWVTTYWTYSNILNLIHTT